MLQTQLERAAAATDRNTRDQLIREIAEETRISNKFEELLMAFISDKSVSDIAAKIVRAIGFPSNAPAIPALLYHGSNANSPAAPDAFQALSEIPPSAVIPHALEMLWDRGSTNKWWKNDIQGLAYLLCQLGADYVRPCGPVITYLLALSQTREDIYIPPLLEALQVMGPEHLSYALPTLFALSEEHLEGKVRVQVQSIIARFDSQAMAPYSQILKPRM